MTADQTDEPDALLESEAEDEDEDEDIPLDLDGAERKLVTQPYDYSVDQLGAHVEKGRIQLMEVPYQREYLWDDAKASRLIESLLLNVPIPVCYFSETNDNVWEVIDGLQRVNSIVRFLRDEFKLRGLRVLSEENGKRFSELSLRDKRRIESRTLRFVVITNESDPEIKFDVFERLNTGAVKLTSQELRNCIYRGEFNDALHEVARESGEFEKILGGRRSQRMKEEELVLRFLALVSDLPGYRPPLSQFLNEYMRFNQRGTPDTELMDLFTDTMSTIAAVLGRDAFRMRVDGKPSGSMNRALFDAVAVSYAFADRAALTHNVKAARSAHAQAIADEGFAPLVGRATADKSRMHRRIKMYSEALESAGFEVALPALPDE